MSAFDDCVYRAVSRIPKGNVACYAQVALAAGYPGAARAVGNTLHRNPFPGVVPCHRVVRADGRPAPGFVFGGPERQLDLLREEGVAVENGRVPRMYFVRSL